MKKPAGGPRGRKRQKTYRIPLVPRRGIGDTTTLARRSMVLSPGANLSPVTVPSGATFQPVDEYGTNCPGSLGGRIEPTWWPAGHMKCGTLGTAFRSFDRLNMNQLTLSQSSPGYKGMARLTESPLVCTRYLRLQIPGAQFHKHKGAHIFVISAGVTCLFTGLNTAQWEESRAQTN